MTLLANRLSNTLATAAASTGGSGTSLPEPFGLDLEDGSGVLEREENDDTLAQEEAP